MTIEIWMPSDEAEERPKSNKRYSDTYKGGKSRSKARTGGKKGYGKNYAGGKSRAYSDSRDDSRDYGENRRKRDYSRDRDKDRRKWDDRDRSRKDYERKDRRDSKPSKNGKGKKGKYERTRTRAGLGADVATTVLTGSSELGGLAGKAVDYAKYTSHEQKMKRYERKRQEAEAKRKLREEEQADREYREQERQRRKDARQARKDRARARDEALKQKITDAKVKYDTHKETKTDERNERLYRVNREFLLRYIPEEQWSGNASKDLARAKKMYKAEKKHGKAQKADAQSAPQQMFGPPAPNKEPTKMGIDR